MTIMFNKTLDKILHLSNHRNIKFSVSPIWYHICASTDSSQNRKTFYLAAELRAGLFYRVCFSTEDGSGGKNLDSRARSEACFGVDEAA